MNTKLKIALMFVGSLCFTMAATLPMQNWYFTAMTVVVFTIGYALKNHWLPSTSPEGTMNFWDVVSGVLTGLMMAGSELLAAYATGAELTARIFWMTVAGAIMTYFTKTIPAGMKS